MSEPGRFLTSFAQALAAMALYKEGHPARERAVDTAYERLLDLRASDSRPLFTFLGDEVLYGQRPLREFHGWDWSARLSDAGVQRLEFAEEVSRDDFLDFLDEMMARVTLSVIGTADARQMRASKIRFGTVGLKGEAPVEDAELPTATLTYSLGEEAATVRWLHDEMRERKTLALTEAEAVVRSLSVAMHSDQQLVLPLLKLRDFDEYTTTHSLNVSVLAMATAEFLGHGPRDVRSFGMSGLLHDLGKVSIPHEILTKPGRLTPEERAIMNAHPVEGARLIIENEKHLDLAAVVAYEHHIMLDGGGYPRLKYARECHYASKIVHVCDVYDALRTNRPYREAWPSEKVLAYLEEKAGTEFDPGVAAAFIRMMRLWERRTAVLESEHQEIRAPGPAPDATQSAAGAGSPSGAGPAGSSAAGSSAAGSSAAGSSAAGSSTAASSAAGSAATGSVAGPADASEGGSTADGSTNDPGSPKR